jgi:hypothetical protein
MKESEDPGATSTAARGKGFEVKEFNHLAMDTPKL